MTILRHPDRPADSNWAVLADFATGSAQLRPEHRAWLDKHAFRALTAPQPGWVFIRGFASSTGESNADEALSNRRASEAVDYLLANPLTDPRHIVAMDARGEDGPGPGATDNSGAAVEVRITPARPAVARQQAVTPKLIERVLERIWLVEPAAGDEADREPVVDDEGWTIFKRDEREMRETAPALRQTHHAYRVTEIHVTQETVTDKEVTMDRCVVHYVWGVAATNVRLFNRSRPVEILTLAQARMWMVNPGQLLF